MLQSLTRRLQHIWSERFISAGKRCWDLTTFMGMLGRVGRHATINHIIEVEKGSCKISDLSPVLAGMRCWWRAGT